jgi:hypothetical protein
MTPIEPHRQPPDQRELLGQSDRLYEQYVKPLESEHRGEFAAVTSDGQVILGKSAHEVGRKAREAFGPGNFVFQIGLRVVGRWR